jgi:tetratricopeptide (TPR) repeat protein
MMDALRSFLATIYSPARGMAMTRDRAPLGPAVLFALITQFLYLVIVQSFSVGGISRLTPLTVTEGLRDLGLSWLLTMLAFVPSLLVVGNFLERRSDALLAVKQEYAPVASCVLYAKAASVLVVVPIALLVHFSGADSVYVANSMANAGQVEQIVRSTMGGQIPPELAAQFRNPRIYYESLYNSILLPFYFGWLVVGVRAVFRFSWLRSAAVVIAGAILMIPVVFVLVILISKLGPILSSPLILLLLFYFMRGYFGELARTQRARLSFRQNLEAAMLNPADASAHYNLGLLHLQRKEYDEARERFGRAVTIDPEEIDSHYQLGRIARIQGRLPDAIAHFTDVVSRDEHHAQNEVWREIGETYLAAGQFEDARNSLEKFLERRQSDPQGLYLMGRAHAGLGHWRDAATAMHACIEAVKTAPAYKYRTEKRWLTEAEEFLRARARSEVVSSQ